MRRSGAWFVALLALDALLRLAVVMRPLGQLDGLLIPDDAYLSLHVARSIAQGLGPWYEIGWTNGVQPLYVMLMVPVHAVFPNDPGRAAHVAVLLLAFCDVLSLAALWRLVGRWTRRPAARVVAALAWVFSPWALQTSVNGLETTLAFLTLVLVFDAARSLEVAGPAAWTRGAVAWLGVLIGLAGLARIDGLLAAPAVAWMLAASARAHGVPLRRVGSALAGAGAVAALVMLPWAAYAWLHTGRVLPISGLAVRQLMLDEVDWKPGFANLYGPMLERIAITVARKSALPIALIGVLAAAIAAMGRRAGLAEFGRRLGSLAGPWGFALLLAAAYAFVIYASWYFNRYLFPFTLPLLLTLAVATEVLLECLDDRPRARAVAAALAVVLVVGGALQPPFVKSFVSAESVRLGYLRLGLWARDQFPPGTRIGALQSGALGYFAPRLVVVNLDGVVNADAAAAVARRDLLGYARRSGVEWIVGWRQDEGFYQRRSADYRPGDLQLVQEIRGFTSWNQPWFLYRLRPAAERDSTSPAPAGAHPAAPGR